MLTFLAANLGQRKSVLTGPFAAMLGVRRPTDWGPDAQAIGWVVSTTAMGEVVQHEGKTSGYRSYVAFDPARHTGVVILANASTEVDLGDVGDLLLIGTKRS
jgi:CubicO group peptidase (beta-lactamase class C family)